MMENRTEPATPRRRAEARKLGMVARSATLTGAVVLLAGAVALQLSSPATSMADMLRGRLSTLSSATEESLVPSVADATIVAARALLPFALIVLAAAILANLAQVGVLFVRPQRGTPERSFWRPAMALVAAGIVASIAVLSFTIVDSWPGFAAQLFQVAMRSGAVLLAFGVVDYLVQRRRIERMLLMTREEVRREQRENERVRP